MGQHFVRPSRAALRARAALVAPLLADGLTPIEISRRTGISPQWISDFRRRHRAAVDDGKQRRGRDARAREALEVRRVAAMQAYEDGMGQAAIARRFQVSAMTVCRWVKALTAGGDAALKRAATTGRPPRKAHP
jgi:transposase